MLGRGGQLLAMLRQPQKLNKEAHGSISQVSNVTALAINCRSTKQQCVILAEPIGCNFTNKIQSKCRMARSQAQGWTLKFCELRPVNDTSSCAAS